MRLQRVALVGVCLGAAALFPVWAGADAGVERKLGLLRYYLDSPGIATVVEQGGAEARGHIDQARELAASARQRLDAGDADTAGEQVTAALRHLSAARGGKGDERQAARNQALFDEVEGYRGSYLQTLRHQGKASGPLDLGAVDGLLAEAREASAAGQHQRAGERLSQAQQMTVSALAAVRDQETVVYALDFKTPADEYQYEVNRHRSYELLIGQMLDRGEGEGAVGKLVERYRGEGRRQREAAEVQAAADDMPGAIETMERANKSLIRALQMMGLPVPG